VLKGKTTPVDVYEPTDGSIDDLPWLSPYLRAFAAFAAGSSDGREQMLAYAATHPDDPIGRLMARKITGGDATTRLFV
jgi:hypothetical protein